jgi:hypothetical protein
LPRVDDSRGAFRRDAPTRLSYAALAGYAFWLYAFGPALALLRAAAPYPLGSLADHLGLQAAFTIEPVLIGACALLLLAGLRLRRIRTKPAASDSIGVCGSESAAAPWPASHPGRMHG